MRVFFFFVSCFSLYLSSPWYLCCSPLAVHPGELSLCVCVCVLLDGGWQTHSSTHPAVLTTVTAYSLQLPLPLPLSVCMCACMRVCVSHPPFECNCNWQGLPCPGERIAKGGGGVQSYSAHILNLYRAWAFFGLPLTTLCACVCECVCVSVRACACACFYACVRVCVCIALSSSLFIRAKQNIHKTMHVKWGLHDIETDFEGSGLLSRTQTHTPIHICIYTHTYIHVYLLLLVSL